ncbi:hypothetical protein GCM10010406_41330 [Streptomyces thermolineatus]|uniref:Uncharacterized protein n=2 Tax=Streptomyces thermolineatus TaxID=44033 RepID=A0ABN3MI37_9ACTN
MPVDHTRTLTAGPVTLPHVAASIGAVYSRGYREEAPGWGAAVELPAVLELLDAIARGEVTPEQAREAFAPVIERVNEYDRKMDRLAQDMADY